MGKSVCTWIRSVLSAYIDGELKPSSTRAVRHHLKHCESCRAHYTLLRSAWELLDDMPSAPVRSGFTSRMMARVVEEKELEKLAAPRREHRVLRHVLASVTGVAAGLVLGFSMYTWTGSNWTGLPVDPASPVEQEVSRHLPFLEDAGLMDEVAVIEAMERLAADEADSEGT